MSSDPAPLMSPLASSHLLLLDTNPSLDSLSIFSPSKSPTMALMSSQGPSREKPLTPNSRPNSQGRASPKGKSPKAKLSRRDSASSSASGDESSPVKDRRTFSEINPERMVKDDQPDELVMLPFLISKGNFEEAERMLRMAVGSQAVDEGVGLKRLLVLMGYQAEMYKLMGLWPLSIGIYLDCAG